MPARGLFVFWDSTKPDHVGISHSYSGLIEKLCQVHGIIKDTHQVYGKYLNVAFNAAFGVFTFSDGSHVIIWKSTVNRAAIWFDTNDCVPRHCSAINRIQYSKANPEDRPSMPTWDYRNVVAIHWKREDVDASYNFVEKMYPEVFAPKKEEPKVVPLAGYVKHMKLYSDPECTQLLYDLSKQA